MKVKAAFFDAGDTLFYSKGGLPVRARALTAKFKELGYSLDEADVLNAIRKVAEHLEKSDVEFHRKYWISLTLLNLGIKRRHHDLIEALYEVYRQTSLADTFIYENATQVLEKLKRRGFLLGLISNTTDYEGLKDVLKKFQLFDLFDSIAASALTTWRKPRSEIFHYALNQLDVKPYEAVHIGDSLRRDVGGAKAVGMYAIWKFKDGEKLEDSNVKPDFIIKNLSEVLDLLEPI
ncbi:HAD family hydrolase [Candidatus Bathyarchaeota archaeon]|nr:HAD family hydrolase [Candidatus Bathyarchaeota archaeon]MBS7613302.1 HAD family hydrolase [Candidatus Bathyarchaeota archaeon]MBS7617943.1 HAD family hydrolase [Candidatus Bathyarchaeota archaeon]